MSVCHDEVRDKRISRMIAELAYELTAAHLDGDLKSEWLGFDRVIGMSKEGAGRTIILSIRTHADYLAVDNKPHLRVVDPEGKL